MLVRFRGGGKEGITILLPKTKIENVLSTIQGYTFEQCRTGTEITTVQSVTITFQIKPAKKRVGRVTKNNQGGGGGSSTPPPLPSFEMPVAKFENNCIAFAILWCWQNKEGYKRKTATN